ncbi:putative potassium transporter [Helianthus annuus]|uniref:Potassium transporter n=1 Tax=Helianthus annuus TaxID=4232 RepID=A0A9K3P3H9_HELAN|nr:putative potassium transporter [Helianthus annuus]
MYCVFAWVRLQSRNLSARGIGLFYNELMKGVPGIFGHFLTTLPAVHSMIISLCIKYTHVPIVSQIKRILFRRVCLKSYHIFHFIIRLHMVEYGSHGSGCISVADPGFFLWCAEIYIGRLS